jgi:hypothetical protein
MFCHKEHGVLHHPMVAETNHRSVTTCISIREQKRNALQWGSGGWEALPLSSLAETWTPPPAGEMLRYFGGLCSMLSRLICMHFVANLIALQQ